MNETKLNAGWGLPVNSRKYHYFKENDTFSLCMHYGFYSGPRENDTHYSPDNCAECKRLFIKLTKDNKK